MDDCEELVGLPDGLSGLTLLEQLYVRSSGLFEFLPESISALKCLQILELSLCSELAGLPEGISGLSSLVTLDLEVGFWRKVGRRGGGGG